MNSKFVEFNNNPKNRRVGDCVIRALSSFLGKDWKDVYTDLATLGVKMCDMPNSTRIYRKYLQSKGYEAQPMPKCHGKKISVKEFLDMYPEGRYLLKVRKHLTYCEDGNCFDTWDCTDYKVGNYWKI